MRYLIHRRQRSEEDDEDLAASIEKLKKELQQSADTIIKRLGSHVTKLEGLLREADDRRMRLEARVADAQRLEWALRQRIEELERRLRDLGQMPPVAPPVAPQDAPLPPMQAAEARRTDGDEFAAVLHQSMLREQARAGENPSAYAAAPAPQMRARQDIPQPPPPRRSPAPPPTLAPAQPVLRTAPVPPVHPPQQIVEEEPPVHEDESIVKARALLRAGRTIEQVARETGVEIGALRLMKQMSQRD